MWSRSASAIAVSVLIAALGNVAPVFRGRGGWDRAWLMAFVFGLVHGLGFADALTPLALTGRSLVRALAGFNLGVELGQAMAICLMLPIMLLIGRLARAVLVYRYASLAVAAAGSRRPAAGPAARGR